MALRYLTTAEAADALGVSSNTVRAYIDAKVLPAFDIAIKGRKRLRISEDDLRAFMDQRASDVS